MFKQIYLVFGAAVLSAAMWTWVQAIAVPHQQAESAERGIPRGNLSDLYPRWLGARELLLHHRNPYGVEITREIQAGYYGRPVDPTRPNDPKDQQAFAYPLYVVLILAPTVKLPFSQVHSAFFWLLAILIATSILLWLQTLGWRLSKTAIALWILLSLNCFPAIQGLKLQQLTILVFALIAGSMTALVGRQFVLAGVLLGMATIKPQLVFFLILWLGIWVLGNWRKRQHVMWSFLGTMAILTAAGEFLLPGWIREFQMAMKDYYRYTGGGHSILDIVLSPIPGRIFSAVLVGVAVIFLWKNRRASERTPAFQWSLSFTLATTLLVIPTFATYNQILLLPGLMMMVRSRDQLWAKGRLSRFLCSVTASSVLWPFLAAACLVLLLAFLPKPTVQKAWGVPIYPIFGIPVTIYTLLLASRRVLCSDLAGQTMGADPRGLRQNAASE